MTTPEALAAIAGAAVACEQRTGLPAALCAAQCILESGWLKHSPGNNCFGIKAAPGAAKRQLVLTREWFAAAEKAAFVAGGGQVVGHTGKVDGKRMEYLVRDHFAVYDTLADCFADHARLITEGAPYAAAWARYRRDGDVQALVLGICGMSSPTATPVGPRYATAPDYYGTVWGIMNQANVSAAIRAARGTGVR